MRSSVAMAVVLLVITACTSHPDAPARQEPVSAGDAVGQTESSERGEVRIVELARGFDHPWALAFLPDGRMLVTERPGRLLLLDASGGFISEISGLPTIFVSGQSGLLDVAVGPDFASSGLIYLSYAKPNWRGNLAGTAVFRARLEDRSLRDGKVIYEQEPKLSSGTHVGSRLVFDDSGHLFVTQGENNKRPTAQDLDKLQGKLVRINPDGSVPADNPFVGQKDVPAQIWSYGHRNMQGAALNPWTKQLWTSEHGPKGGDEINIPQAGKNYGWPIITYGINYDGDPIPEAIGTEAPGMEQPHHYWKVSPAVSGMAFYDAEQMPGWKGNLFMGALAGTSLIRLELEGDAIVHEERLLKDRGERIRDVRVGPDGRLYALTDADSGKLLRIELVSE
ncbi:PQQ-dependent sugar dehydrogenase [Dokdonella sp.]|uniref:PQQ-dependent sugar dehydrogenase n=1 Tax=Dokdonella sp. TaxID=2291710 RepID=UPI003526C826